MNLKEKPKLNHLQMEFEFYHNFLLGLLPVFVALKA